MCLLLTNSGIQTGTPHDSQHALHHFLNRPPEMQQDQKEFNDRPSKKPYEIVCAFLRTTTAWTIIAKFELTYELALCVSTLGCACNFDGMSLAATNMGRPGSFTRRQVIESKTSIKPLGQQPGNSQPLQYCLGKTVCQSSWHPTALGPGKLHCSCTRDT